MLVALDPGTSQSRSEVKEILLWDWVFSPAMKTALFSLRVLGFNSQLQHLTSGLKAAVTVHGSHYQLPDKPQSLQAFKGGNLWKGALSVPQKKQKELLFTCKVPHLLYLT